MAKKSENMDITLDFSWIKKLFSNKNKDSNNLFAKYGFLLLLLIPIILSIYIRALPYDLPMAEQWATQSVVNSIRAGIQQQINKQYANLPQQSKDALINEQLQVVLSQQQDQINSVISAQTEQIKLRFKDETGTTYLGDIDSYFWLRYARNILETGQLPDEYRDGIGIDNHMNAPNSAGATNNLYPYVEVFLYKFMRIFDSSFNLLKAGFYTPLFLSFFAIIAAFFIGKKLSGNVAGLLASILVTVNPVVLSRSLGSDNDIVNAVFPLLVMLFVIHAFDSKTTKDTIIYAAITGLLLGIYSFAWSGWWFMFLFIIVSLGIYLGYIVIFDIIDKEKNIKDIAKNKTIHRIGILVGVYLITTFISLAIFGNAGEFINSFTNPLNILSLKEAARGINIWPNVYTTVAELNSAGIEQIINSIGGMLFFWVALVGSLLFFTNFKEKKHNLVNIVYIISSAIYFFFLINITASGGMTVLSFVLMLSIPMFVGLMLSLYYKYELEPMHSILMVVWFMATIYSVTKGVRFILLIVPIFAVSFGTFLGILVDKASNSIAKALDMDIKIPKISLFILLALIIIPSIRTGVAVSSSYTPGINDAWVESLEKIKSQSQPDAIINSWWDFGHWFKYFADRAVTSDGASQNSQQAHWVGKVLLTGDEEQAIAILRMLDCGGTDAESELTKITGDTYLTVNMLYRFFGMDESAVRKELLTITSEEKTEKILSYMFCEPPEDYFITSQDMVGKAGVWAHFGIWDFKRAKIYSYHKTQTFSEFTTALVDELGYTQQQAQTIYYEISALTSDSQINNWIAPWPSYAGRTACQQTEQTMVCQFPTQNGGSVPLQIDLATYDTFIDSNGQKIRPKKIGYMENGMHKTKTFEGNVIGTGVELIDNNLYIMDEHLVGSMFTRLFYRNGEGLQKFEKYHDVTDITGNRIITWKINWEK